MREIRKQQKSTKLLVPRTAMERLIRELAAAASTTDAVRFSPGAIDALQQSSESFITDMFAQAMKIRAHHKQITLRQGDVTFAVQQHNGTP